MKKLESKTALITGGLSGIGLACAIAAAAEGANVVVADIRSVSMDAAMIEIKSENESAVFIECDVTKIDQVKDLIAKVTETFSSLDIALNCAGIAGESTTKIADITEADWNSVLNVNLNGVFNCMKYELLQMVQQKSGSIINMASVFGKVGFKHFGAYVTAKHGVIGLTQTAALEYASEGIRVNSICPGFIETPLLTQEGITEDLKSKEIIAGLHALNRFGKPEEIAKAFIYLASSDSSFVTGSSLTIDGGFLAQ